MCAFDPNLNWVLQLLLRNEYCIILFICCVFFSVLFGVGEIEFYDGDLLIGECGKQGKMETGGKKTMGGHKNGRRSNRERKMALIQDVLRIFLKPCFHIMFPFFFHPSFWFVLQNH